MGCPVEACSSTGPLPPSPPTTAIAAVVVAAAAASALRGLACFPPTMEAYCNPPSYSDTGLEEIFDEKFKAFTSLDYNDYGPIKPHIPNNDTINQSNSNAINDANYTNINGTTCNIVRSSPPPKGRSSPSLVMPRRPFPQHANNPKPDPWVCNNILNGTPSDINGPNPLAINTSLHAINGSSTRPGTPSMMGCEASLSPKRLSSPSIKSKVLANRDKESLMDEIISLKKAYLDQSTSLQRQKVHATNLESENRKLEKELEEIELQGNVKGSIRPGSPSSRLRAKVQGLKARVAQLEATCEGQAEELQILRRDMRVTRTREIEAERDIFAEEIERLQSFVRRLKALQNRLFCENKQLSRYKDRTSQLEAANQRLETSITELQKSLEKANKESFESTRRGNESTLRAKRAERQCQDLQVQLAYVTAVLEKEKSEKVNLQQMIHILQEEVQTLQSSQHSVSSKSNKARTNLSSSDQGHWEEDDTEVNNLGILAKTWGFLHRGKLQHSAQKAVDHHQVQAEEVDYEKMLGLPKRPETRGEPRSRSLLAAPPNNSSLSNGLVLEKARSRSPSKTSSSVGRRFSGDSGPRLPTPPRSREASDVASSAMLYADHSTPQSSSTQPSSSVKDHHHHQISNNKSERGYQSDNNYDQSLVPRSTLTATRTQTADRTLPSPEPSSASTSEPMAPQVVAQASFTQGPNTAVLSSSREDTTPADTSSSLMSGSSISTANLGELDPVRRIGDAATAKIQEDLLQATRDGAGSRREATSSSGGGEVDGEGGAGGKAHQLLVPKLHLEQVGGKTQESKSDESAIQTSASTSESYTQKSDPLNGDTSQGRLQPP